LGRDPKAGVGELVLVDVEGVEHLVQGGGVRDVAWPGRQCDRDVVGLDVHRVSGSSLIKGPAGVSVTASGPASLMAG
jgi:hypothetical protein